MILTVKNTKLGKEISILLKIHEVETKCGMWPANNPNYIGHIFAKRFQDSSFD